MTNPHQRTHGRRRLAVRLPSGRRTLHFEPRAHAHGECARCGRELHGVPTTKPQNYARSSRSPSRPFAGVLCPNCLSAEVRNIVRATGTAT